MKDEQKERDLLSELELLKDVSKQLVQEHDRVVKEFDRIHHELERIRKHPQPKAS